MSTSVNPKSLTLFGTLVSITCLLVLVVPPGSTHLANVVMAVVGLIIGVFEVVAGFVNLRDDKTVEAMALGSVERRRLIREAQCI